MTGASVSPAIRSALSAAVGACAAVAVFTVAQDTPERSESRYAAQVESPAMTPRQWCERWTAGDEAGLGAHVRQLDDDTIENAWSSMSNVLWLADEGELQDPQRRHDAATVYAHGYEALEARCAEVLS